MPKKKEVPVEVKPVAPVAPVEVKAVPKIVPLTHDFSSVAELNILRDKINEIIAKQ